MIKIGKKEIFDIPALYYIHVDNTTRDAVIVMCANAGLIKYPGSCNPNESHVNILISIYLSKDYINTWQPTTSDGEFERKFGIDASEILG